MISKEREEILKRIEQYELEGNFDTDVENDPPSKVLLPDEIDYLRKKLKNKIARFFVSKYAEKAMIRQKRGSGELPPPLRSYLSAASAETICSAAVHIRS